MLMACAFVARYPASFRLWARSLPRDSAAAARSSAVCGFSRGSPFAAQPPSPTRTRLIASYGSLAAASKQTASNSKVESRKAKVESVRPTPAPRGSSLILHPSSFRRRLVGFFLAAAFGGIARSRFRRTPRGGFEQQPDRLGEHLQRRLLLAGQPFLQGGSRHVERIAQRIDAAALLHGPAYRFPWDVRVLHLNIIPRDD